MFCPNCHKDFDSKFCPSCGYSPEAAAAAAPVHTPPASSKAPKKRGCLIAVLVVLGVFVLLVIIGSLSGPSKADSSASSTPASASAKGESKPPESKAPESKAPAQPKSAPFEVELSSGHYTAGVDFPAGKYNITAVSGGGNVSSSNMFDGGLNAMLGDKETNERTGGKLYEQEYKNIKLPEGTSLSVSGLTVKISSEAASTAPLTPRSQAITDVVELGSGNYLAGEDFPAGIYNIAAVSGGGNVSSSNMMDGGLNAILGDAESAQALGGSFYDAEYKNIDLPKGTELKVNGLTVSLTPSK